MVTPGDTTDTTVLFTHDARALGKEFKKGSLVSPSVTNGRANENPSEWQEVSRVLMNDMDTFVAQRLAELYMGKAGKTFRA